MTEAAATTTRFQMVGARAAILTGPVAESIDQQIRAIEHALESVPDFAFDLSKTLVESVCKTVLADIGKPADPRWECPKLLRETLNQFSLMPADHPDPAKGRESVTRTINGMLQAIQGLCELRNNYGIASHGRDNFAPRLALRQATLAAQAADTIVSFLYRIHRDARSRTPGDRIYYEDHQDFNDTLDQYNELIRIKEVELLPSRVLYHTDREAYKDELNDFLAQQAAPERPLNAGPEAPA
jgi:hypothetical protein